MGGKQSKQDKKEPDVSSAEGNNLNKKSSLSEKPGKKSSSSKPSKAQDSTIKPKNEYPRYKKIPRYINAAIGREWLDPLSRARLLTADVRGLATLGGEYYKTDAEKDKLNALLNRVLTGRPDDVLKLLKTEPLLFFKVSKEITDPSGRTFSNVSAADLISWIGDDDMLDKVNTFAEQLEPDELRQEFFKQWRKQLGFSDENEPNQTRKKPLGGADIVMVGSDSELKYDEICKCTNTFDVMPQ